MAQKTWFFPPSFDFFPDGELSLGSVIAHPDRPTLSLASLSPVSHPEIILPKVGAVTEADHSHSRSRSASVAAAVFLKLVGLALEAGNVHASRFTNTTYGNVQIETRTFNGGFREDSIKAIVGLAQVKKYIDSGTFGKRPIYIVSGLRIAKDSFQVTTESRSAISTLARVTTSVATESLSLTGGSNATNNREQSNMDSYKTAPGIVFAYRLHVIRTRRDGQAEAELFSHRTAFLTGEADDEEEEAEEEWECREVTAKVLLGDMEINPDFDEYPMGDGEESCIACKITK
ncbi:hypothetical protein Trco_002156 [Trichoderma cornu-damae]|uniref:Uncharacterized protein n=1 Tax=Trichoderma cornu-damae TaxID=654480 RepID=A0A9P8QM33_9HYPO|nr:hypothetical protein Trco_002156 [Trichoderma cornu-damae]